MKTIYETVHDGVVGRVVESDYIHPDRPYADQLQVMLGFGPGAPRLSTEEFEPRVWLVVLELQNYLRDEYVMAAPNESLRKSLNHESGINVAEGYVMVPRWPGECPRIQNPWQSAISVDPNET